MRSILLSFYIVGPFPSCLGAAEATAKPILKARRSEHTWRRFSKGPGAFCRQPSSTPWTTYRPRALRHWAFFVEPAGRPGLWRCASRWRRTKVRSCFLSSDCSRAESNPLPPDRESLSLATEPEDHLRSTGVELHPIASPSH